MERCVGRGGGAEEQKDRKRVVFKQIISLYHWQTYL